MFVWCENQRIKDFFMCFPKKMDFNRYQIEKDQEVELTQKMNIMNASWEEKRQIEAENQRTKKEMLAKLKKLEKIELELTE